MEQKMQKHIILGTSLTLLAALMTGCEINDDVNPNPNFAAPNLATTQVTITPSLGKILNAKVVLKNAKTGAMLGEGTTGNTGVAAFTATKTTDPVVIEVQGVDGAQGAMYFDEAKNANVAFPASQKIRAIAPTLSNDANIGVSILTELASQTAEKALGGSLANATATVVNEANAKVKMLLAKELGEASLLTPPTIIAKDSVIKDLITASNAANDYAIKLAALAKLGTGDTPVLDLLQKLSDDISDGALDGKKGESTIAYNHDTSSFNAALDSYLANYIEQAKINSIYTAELLAGFKVVNGNIVITINNGGTGGGTNGGNTGSGTSSGNFNLTAQTSVSGFDGLPIPSITIQNVPKPDTQSAFCDDSAVKDALPDGAITITGCSFSGNSGTISVQLNQGILLNYTVTYTYTPA
jgi:hypothetical protein